MIILPGEPGTVSFTDDSSPDSRVTNAVKVSIHAQVVREDSLEWFHRLISYFPDVPGELKSHQIIGIFGNLSPAIQDEISDGLRRVRIHISDPRPYQDDIRQIIGSAWGDYRAVARLQLAADRGDPVSMRFVNLIQELTSERVLMNAPASRLAAKVLDPEQYKVWLDVNSRVAGKDIERLITGARRPDKSALRKATILSSKSAAVFAEAIDEAGHVPTREEWSLTPFDPRSRINFRVLKALARAHGYDVGDSEALDQIKSHREKLAAILDRTGMPMMLEPISEFVSSESVFGQAADVSARFAAVEYERGGIEGVVQRFDYVTFNGERVSQRTLSEFLRRQRELRKMLRG